MKYHKENCQCCICKSERHEPLSSSHKLNISISKKGMKFSDEHKINLSLNHRKSNSKESNIKRIETIKLQYKQGRKVIIGKRFHKKGCSCSFCMQERREGFNFKHQKKCNCIKCKLIRKELSGKKHPAYGNIPWNFDKEFYEKFGIKKSSYPYNDKFTYRLKRKLREFYDNRCVVTGMSNNEHKKLYGRHLFIHHWNYNKIEIDPYWMVPVCQTINNLAEQDKEGWMSLFGGIVQEHYSNKNY